MVDVDEMGWDGSDHDRFIQRRFELEPLSSRTWIIMTYEMNLLYVNT